MNWVSIAKLVVPILLITAVYFYAHDAGWEERDALVAGEKQAAAETAVAAANTICKQKQELTSGVSHDYQIKLKTANDRLADAIASLHDARHGADQVTRFGGSTGRRDGSSGDHRLYYADEGAAITALSRAGVASRQAEQLVSCQAFIRKERETK